MKKTHDNNEGWFLFTIALALVAILPAILVASWAASEVVGDLHSGNTGPIMALYTTLIWILFLELIVLFVMPRWLGINPLAYPYADAYSCMNAPALTCWHCVQDTKKAQFNIELYMQFTRCEIESFYRIARRKGSGSFRLPEQHFPAPIGDNSKLSISRRTARKILRELKDGRYEYVLLRWNLEQDYLGEPAAECGECLSLRDIRRIGLILSGSTPDVGVFSAVKKIKYSVDRPYLDLCMKKVDKENAHYSIYEG